MKTLLIIGFGILFILTGLVYISKSKEVSPPVDCSKYEYEVKDCEL